MIDAFNVKICLKSEQNFLELLCNNFIETKECY